METRFVVKSFVRGKFNFFTPDPHVREIYAKTPEEASEEFYAHCNDIYAEYKPLTFTQLQIAVYEV